MNLVGGPGPVVVPLFQSDRVPAISIVHGVEFLRDVLNDQTYRHFLCLSIGYIILNSKNYKDHNGLGIARQLLTLFIKNFKLHYDCNLTYNVHSLLHLPDCVEQFGCLESFSAC